MKKQKLPGDNISLKTKKTEVPAILEWINTQSNLMDSLRYLIENEIKDNGIRNLQQHIPADRGFTFQESGTSPSDKPQELVQANDEPQIDDEDMEDIEDDIDDDDIESWM